MKDTDVLSHVADLWAAGDSLHSKQLSRWAQNKRLATSRHITRRKVGQSSLFVPKTEAIHSRKQADYLSTFGGKDPVSLKRTMSSTKEGARIMEKVVNYYISDAGIDWDAFTLNQAHDSLTYNFSPWLVEWDRGTEVIKTKTLEVDPETGEATTKTVKEEVETHSFPVVTNIPPEDFRIDPAASWDTVGKARFAVIRIYRDKAYATRMAKEGIWPEIEEGAYQLGTTGVQTLAAERSTLFSSFDKSADIDNGLLEVLYTYYYEEYDGEMKPSLVVTLKDIMVLEEPTSLELDISNTDGTDAWPFGVTRVYVEPFEIYSRAMPEKVENMQLETNAIRNQRRDNVALVLNREKFMTPEAGVDPAVLSRSYAGKVTTVKAKDSVWWDVPPEVTQSSYREEQASVSDIESLVAESPQRMGQSAARKESATEVKISSANANQAMALDVNVFAMTGPARVVEKLIRMIRLAADPQIFEAAAAESKVFTEDAYTEAITGDYRVSVGAGASQAAADLAISNAVNIASVLQSVYGPTAQYNELMRPMLEALGLDPDKILPAPQGEVNTAPQDLGGTVGEGNLTAQPTAVLNGGGFGAKQ